MNTRRKWFSAGLVCALLGLGGILLAGVLVSCDVIPQGSEEPAVSATGYGLLLLTFIGALVMLINGESGFPKR